MMIKIVAGFYRHLNPDCSPTCNATQSGCSPAKLTPPEYEDTHLFPLTQCQHLSPFHIEIIFGRFRLVSDAIAGVRPNIIFCQSLPDRRYRRMSLRNRRVENIVCIVFV